MSLENEKQALEKVYQRIQTTSNNELSKILEKLLPSLLPLCNKNELRSQVLIIITNIIRRIKSLNISLNCSNLFKKLIIPEMLPYTCNITLTIIDICISNIPQNDRQLTTSSIIESLELFENEYSTQVSTLLWYLLKFIPELSYHLKNLYTSKRVQNLISSWLLDVVLIQPGLKKDTVGSIQEGLSRERVNRLTTKVEKWDFLELKEIKLKILEFIDITWIPSTYLVAIYSICSCDVALEVSKEAGYKLNGVKSAIQNSQQTSTINDSIIFLLHLNMIGYDEEVSNNIENNNNIVENELQLEQYWRGWSLSLNYQKASHNFDHIISAQGLELRIPFREDVRCQMLKWITQEALPTISPLQKLDLLENHSFSIFEQIDGLSLSILQMIRRVFSNTNEFRSINPLLSVKYLAFSIDVVCVWIQNYVNQEILEVSTSILIKVGLRSLSRYSMNQNITNPLVNQDETNLLLKRVR